MIYVFVILAAIGHVILWVAIVNRLHAYALNRTLMHFLTGLCGLAVVGIPPLLLFDQIFHLRFEPPGWNDLDADELAVRGYLIVCAAVCVIAAAHRLCTMFHSERRGTLVANHTTSFDVRRLSSERLTRPGVATWLANLPGNEIFKFHVHEKQLVIPRLPVGLAGLRVAHLSDLHMSGRIEQAYFRAVVEQVNESHPDLIALTGDLIERNECLNWIPETFGRLRAPLGVYYVRGNHDLKVDQARLNEGLAAAGLVPLGGHVLSLTHQGELLLLAGNELPWFGPAPKLAPSNADAQSPALRLLLAHSPDQFAWAQAHNFDLILAGHNHGGQVRFPLFGPLLAPSRHGIRYAAGVFRRGNTVLHVSRGTASHTPLRYNCPPEVAVLVLQPTKSPEHSGRN